MAVLKEHKLDRGYRVFRNPFLDVMSRAHPAIPAVMWLPVAAVFVGLAVYFEMAAVHFLWALPLGFLTWTFSEYWLHRSFFHWRPNSPMLARMQYWVHEHHHRYQEWDRLVAPPMMALPIFVFFVALFWFVFGGTISSMPHPSIFPTMAGFIFGYLAYDYTHFATHFWPCRSAWMKNRRKLHYQHHFAFPDRWYGISMPLWDYVFRTHVKKGDKSRNTKTKRDEAAAGPRHAMDVYAEYVASLVQTYAEQDGRKDERPAASLPESANGAAAPNEHAAAEANAAPEAVSAGTAASTDVPEEATGASR